MLDLGSGEGELEEKIKNVDSLVKIGVDVSQKSLRHGLKRKRYNKIIGVDIEEGLEKINLEGKVDIVVVAEVLEHLRHPGIFIEKEVKPLLKDGGYLMGSVPNMAQIHDIIGLATGRGESYQAYRPLMDFTSGHISFFSINSLKKILRLAGYTNIRIIGNGVRLRRRGDLNLFWLSKLPYFKNFSDRFIFICKKNRI